MDLSAFLLSLITIYVCARIMGELAVRIGQSAVLGELLAGVLIGGSGLGWLHETETLTLLGQVGVMLLLFEIGLESDIHSFLRVGRSAATVAAIGVVAPFALGYGLALMLGLSQFQAIFIGATLTATSVALSASVLSELGKLKTAEGHIILGAAVLDDLLGLVILSVVIGLATSGLVSWMTVGWTAGLAMAFLVTAIVAGIRYAHLLSRLIDRLSSRGGAVIVALTFALFLGYLADRLQIAPLVGAFAAGLVLARSDHQTHIQERIRPVADVFVPIFFVLIGAAVELRHFNPLNEQNWPTLWLAGGLTLVAIIGKLAAGLGAWRESVNRWAIGVGMLPRGEVGLIFAGVGLSHRILDEGQYGAILLVVALTTLIAPLLLKRTFRKA
ncbi:MAG: cation:proton antiporter [Nitrospira sp.]|nr:cation:proton antiporter [Nitrospira sp.]